MSSAPNSLAIVLATASTLSCARTSSLIRFAAPRSRTLSSATSVAMTLPPSLVKASAMARPMPCPAAVTSATLPWSLSLISSSCGVQCGEADFLPAISIKIFRRQPAFEIALARRPFVVEHRKPRVVAIAALGNHVLAEGALVDEPVTQRRSPRRRIQRVAFPFIAAIAERLENVTRQQILGFGAEPRALRGWRIEHVPDFNNAMHRNNTQQRQIADGAILQIDDRIGIGIVGRRTFGNEGGKFGRIGEWAVGGNI